MDPEEIFSTLENEVIRPGLCTHCGTCVGLSTDTLEMVQTDRGPLPVRKEGIEVSLHNAILDACPGKGINYPEVNEFVFSQQPDNWLVGCYQNFYIGYSLNPTIRRQGASGGVITQILLYLLTQGLVDGAVILRQGWPLPWNTTPIIAQSVEEISASSQSVYVPTSVNSILEEMAQFEGKLAFVGLPDQVASLRQLQKNRHPGALKVEYVLGIYFGTGFYLEAIECFLRMNGVHSLEEISEIRYREGEWPGNLQIRTSKQRILRAEKFYYNYLIPFYITQASLLSVDFTNELTDISVGDAWNPTYESQGGGFSVVIARTRKANQIISDMAEHSLIHLSEIRVEDAVSMHAHMLDFKKRGSFIRIALRKKLRQPSPDYGYLPSSIPASRYLIELVITFIFGLCHTKLARRILEKIPIDLVGPMFEELRKVWKDASKPTKRKGLYKTSFRLTGSQRTKN